MAGSWRRSRLDLGRLSRFATHRHAELFIATPQSLLAVVFGRTFTDFDAGFFESNLELLGSLVWIFMQEIASHIDPARFLLANFRPRAAGV